VHCLLLDEGLRPVPRGAAGEIHLGGPGIARGYLGRPALTAQRFVPAPGGERLYKTGDRARLRADGALEFLGRTDDQVKLRGLRVEPGEIAAVLVRHPAVEECEVLLRDLPSGQQGLVAHTAVMGALEEAELRAFLRTTLPEYMVPAAFVLLPELPKTTSGKIHRRALLAQPLTVAEPTATAPTSAFEGRIAAIWAEVLGLEQVGIDDNFFDLGGDSLLLLHLHRLLEERLERPLKVLDLFQHTTVRALARHLGGEEERPRHDKARELVAKRKAARKRRKPRRR
jgi:acyl carrier protein